MDEYGPTLGDIQGDAIVGRRAYPAARYQYELRGGELFVVGGFGRARVHITIDTVPTLNGSWTGDSRG